MSRNIPIIIIVPTAGATQAINVPDQKVLNVAQKTCDITVSDRRPSSEHKRNTPSASSSAQDWMTLVRPKLSGFMQKPIE